MKTEILDVIRFIGGSSDAGFALVITLFLSILACVVAVDRLGHAFKFPITGTNRAAGLVLGALAIGVVAVAAANIYVLPRVEGDALQKAVPIITALLVFLAVAAPCACFMFKSPYFKTVFAMLLGVAAAVAVSLLAQGAIRAIRAGGKDFEKTRQRTEKINKMM